jgi:hypothetical protein
MKKTVFFVTCGLFFLVFLIACDKIFLEVEGKEADLQGKWQMDNADTVFYNFQKNLLLYQIFREKDQISQVAGYYIMHGDTAIDLRLLRIYASFPMDYLGWDTLYSANSKRDTLFKAYTIDKLTSKKLILSSKDAILSFHKF